MRMIELRILVMRYLNLDQGPAKCWVMREE
jgi:hypothetical protein